MKPPVVNDYEFIHTVWQFWWGLGLTTTRNDALYVAFTKLYRSAETRDSAFEVSL